MRKAVDVASVNVKVTQESANKVRTANTATASGIPGSKEDYVLDWKWHTSHDSFFGYVKGRSRWITQDDVWKDGAEGEWLDADSEGNFIQAVGKKADDAWTATHL